MIVELVGNIDLIRAGVRAFRLSTPDGQGGHQLGEEVDTAREVAKSLGRLTRFVAENHMLLGPTVLGAWCVHYGALQELRIALNASTARAADVTDALGSLLPPFQDAIAEAIRCELQGADLKFLPSAERERLVKEGVGKGERLLAEAKDGPGRGGKADAEKG